MAANRLQGYLYVPLEIEGEIKISSPNAPTALNFLLGYRYLILGNHFTATSNYGFTDDYHVIQKKGFGINALLGITFLENSHRRGIYLVMSIGISVRQILWRHIVYQAERIPQFMNLKITATYCACNLVWDFNFPSKAITLL